ncbi:hypothetical protein DCAR_0623309 [Daucus carota subsp. sativus]|nr:hypothetical protein DCAR_0623309 [Daucus carota subsp. sativus]
MEAGVVQVERRGRGRKRKIEEIENVCVDGLKRETRSKALVGSYVNKEFEGSFYLGKVVSYDRGLYRVEYEDGDSEDFESGELRPFLIENDCHDSILVLRKKELDEIILNKYEKERVDKMRGADVIGGVEDSPLGEVMDHGANGVIADVDCSSDSGEDGLDGALCVDAEACIVLPPEFPPSTGNIGVPEESVAELLSVYSFLRSFSVSLCLCPFGLEDFVGSLNCSVQNTLLDAIHVALMRVLRRHFEALSSEGSEFASKCLSSMDWSLIDSLTWPVFTAEYMMMMGYTEGPKWKGFYVDALQMEYYSLTVSRKLVILQILCDDVLDSAELRAQVDMREESEVEVDRDGDTIATHVGPKRVHPRYSKTSACKDQEATEFMKETGDAKLSINSSSLGYNNNGLDAGTDGDQDANSDECRLCGMDGTLLCCDGCPSSYHSRCIGVSKLCIPKGDWYCPECAINKISPKITGRTSLIGAEFFGVDPFEQVFLGTCDHLLVLKVSMNTGSIVRYYHKEDLSRVVLALCSEAQHLDMYSGICERIIKYWQIPANIIPIAEKVETGLSSIKIEDGSCPTPVSSLLNRNGHGICEPSVSEDIASCIAESSSENIAGPSAGNLTIENDSSKASLNMHIETGHPLTHPCNSGSIEQDRPFQAEKLSEQIRGTATISSDSVSHQDDLSETTQLKLVGRSSQRDHAMCTSGNSNSCNRGQSNCMISIKSCSNIGDGCFYLGSSFKPQAYMNHYIHGDFAASAAANLVKLSSEENYMLVSKTSNNYKKAMSANIALQIKAFSSAVNRFFWPNSEKKLMEVPRERCSWCLSCKAMCQSKRGCLLNAAASNAIKGTMKILSGICPVKLKHGQGSLHSIATYVLLMEESLRGLTVGPFKTLDYRKKWCQQAEQASTCSAIKSLLLELEENMNQVAFSGDWFELVDGWSVESSATNGTSAAEPRQKRGPGGRFSRKLSAIPEIKADDDLDMSNNFVWWRGGILSKFMFHKGILPQILVKRSARQGGSRKISGIYYAEGVETPKRSRRFIWRAAVEMSRNVSQLSTQVRYLDIHVRWSDLLRPDQSSLEGKGAETEAYVFRNASICDKQILGSKVRYAVSFGNQKHLPSRIMKNVIGVEKHEDETEKYWFLETHIPLYLVKEYEEKMDNVHLRLAEKPMNVLSKMQKQQLKVSRKDIFFYLTQRRDNLESCRCASCQLDVFLGNAVTCSKCEGYCHLQCTSSPKVHMSVEVEFVMTCKRCYQTEATLPNEKYPASHLLLQRQKPLNAATAKKSEKQNGCHRPLASNGALQHSVRKKPASNLKPRNKSKDCFWGLVKKKNGEDGTDFRLKNILLKGNLKLSEVECDLCKKPYDSNLIYICCEICTKWYHADAVELEESKILEVTGFKCCKCRRMRSPRCPYADQEETDALESKKSNKRASKQASQVAGSYHETIPEQLTQGDSATHMLPIKKGLVCIKGDNPLTFSLSRMNNGTQQTSEVALEQNPTFSGSVPQKLPVRRHLKQDDDVVGYSTNNTSVDSPKPIPGSTFLPVDESAPCLEWDVSTNIEDDFMFDVEDLNYEDGEFEPQTYFSFNELLAFDDGVQLDGIDPSGNIIVDVDDSSVIPEDVNLEQYGIVTEQQEHLDSFESSFQVVPCQTCFFTDPIPDSCCQICGSCMHSHCAQWVVDTSNNGAWRCGSCRNWQ